MYIHNVTHINSDRYAFLFQSLMNQDGGMDNTHGHIA